MLFSMDLLDRYRLGGEMEGYTLKAYKDAWIKLQEEVLNEKTGWGKEELKIRMDKLLIKCMGAYLG